MLTPAEIQSREFLVSLRGYDRDEVQAFLEEVAALVGQLQAGEEVAPAPAEVPAPSAPSEAPKDHFADVAAQTQRVLEAAYAAAEEIRHGAERQRDEMIAKAKREASDVLSELAVQRRAEEAGLAELAQRRQHHRDELAALAGSLGGLVGELDAANPDSAGAATPDAPPAQKPAGPTQKAVPAENAAKAVAPKEAREPELADAPAGGARELDQDQLEDLDAAEATADARDEEAQQELLADAEASAPDPPGTGARSASSSQARRGRRS